MRLCRQDNIKEAIVPKNFNAKHSVSRSCTDRQIGAMGFQGSIAYKNPLCVAQRKTRRSMSVLFQAITIWIFSHLAKMSTCKIMSSSVSFVDSIYIYGDCNRTACLSREKECRTGKCATSRVTRLQNLCACLLRALSLSDFEDLECFFGRLDTTQGHGAERRSYWKLVFLPWPDLGLEAAYPSG